jgi:NAD(P)-dependent dehydrogenase (short-subunit alcohol dehydrogenase family)
MTQPRLAGKRVIVTGAANGLGREFTLHLARLGARVLAADIDEDRLATTGALADEQGTPVAVAPTDVSSAEQTAALAQRAVESLGALDGLVNNAAAMAGLTRRRFDEIEEAEWDHVQEVNVKGAWLCAKSALPLLRDAGGGSIVNLSSEVAFSGSPGLAHYVVSKAAVIGLTHVLAKELGQFQIRVNALAPGFIPTSGSRGMLTGAQYDHSATPLGRVGAPRDLLGALAFLISDDSSFVSGQTLLVNGGRVLS